MAKQSQSKQTKAEAKRSYLIAQATRCLAEKGYAHVSLRDIARESGVSLGILHYYFASKEELLISVIQSYKEGFIKQMEQDLLEHPASGWMERLVANLRHALVHDKEIHRLWYDFQVQAMYLPAFREHVNEIRSRMIDLIGRVVNHLQAEGQMTADRFSRDTLAATIYSLIDGLFFQALLDEHEQPEEAVGRLEQALPAVLAPFLLPTHSPID